MLFFNLICIIIIGIINFIFNNVLF